MQLSGSPIDYFFAFFGGVLVSFTPCVFPLIPVTAGFIGVSSEGSRLKGMVLSLLYVTGVAVTYSILGLIAVLTGKFFGRIGSSPWTYLFVGVVVIFFGLAMLDLFPLIMPNIMKVSKVRKGNYFAAFVLGLSSGLVVGPCLTPVLGSILTYLGTTKNVFYGTTLLFTFAYGMGFVLVLVGTFSSAMVTLPKSGRWMLYIKKVCAAVLLCAGAYFIYVGIRRI